MRSAIGCLRSAGFILLAACVTSVAPGAGWAGEDQTVDAIADAFAQDAIQRGVAVGVGIGVIDKTRSGFKKTYTYGYADRVKQTRFATNSIFEIGSTTKVFTTNLLGQAVFENRLGLDNQLGQFPKEFGKFKHPLTAKVTLEQLGDFTGGFPTYAPICNAMGKPIGCRPSERPTIDKYGAADFLSYFQNFKESTPSLPAPYDYSDYSTGLLGLFLGTAPGRPMTDYSLDGWYASVDRRILRPLGMTSTFLYVPADQARRTANGYDLAIAAAEVSGGAIGQIDLLGGGEGYSTPPQVTITGGGGSGAMATATVDKGHVAAISVEPGAGGSGYLAPPTIVFNNGGSSKLAHAIPIVSRGEVEAILVLFGGTGYQRVPQVTISGGGGIGASAIAHIANGRVVAVTVTNGGSGYADPLSVIVAPGGPLSSGVPIWAPAGALQSTLDDLMRFAAAALVAGPPPPVWPYSLTAGFQIAEQAYACQNKNPDLSSCPATTNRAALAWAIYPADQSFGVPEVIVKDGGLPGFSSEILLMPDRKLAVVVLVNSRSHATDPTGRFTFRPAETLAANIGYNLFFALSGKTYP